MFHRKHFSESSVLCLFWWYFWIQNFSAGCKLADNKQCTPLLSPYTVKKKPTHFPTQRLFLKKRDEKRYLNDVHVVNCDCNQPRAWFSEHLWFSSYKKKTNQQQTLTTLNAKNIFYIPSLTFLLLFTMSAWECHICIADILMSWLPSIYQHDKWKATAVSLLHPAGFCLVWPYLERV